MREYIDNLTGLYNLFYLKENYSKYIEKREKCYLISIDLKKLKYINDNFGHDAGDKSLITFANSLLSVFKNSLIIRRSGDEFVILTELKYNQIIENLKIVDQRLLEEYQKGKIPIGFNFNCGIKSCDNNLEETMYKSDITMYEAKNNDKFYEDYRDEFLLKIQCREAFIQKIDKLIENNLITYAVQKIFDIDGKTPLISQIYSRDSDGLSIFSNDKFKTLKINYRIKRIDVSSIQNLLKNIIPTLDGNIRYMINVHYDTLLSRECNFINLIKGLQEENNYSFQNIILSITVSGCIDNFYKLIDIIIELRKIGFSICIDDLNFSENDIVLSIVSVADIDYVNIHKKVLVKAINEKKYNTVLEYVIKLLLDLNITPIFVNVESLAEVEFIKNISDKCLIRGFVYSEEKKLKK